jgi:hypothetical protein
MYYEGAAVALGIPDELDAAPPVSLTYILILLVSALFILHLAMGVAGDIVISARKQMSRTIPFNLLITIVFLAGSIFLAFQIGFTDYWVSLAARVAFFAFIASVMYGVWLRPLRTHADVEGYPAKLQKARDAAELQRAEEKLAHEKAGRLTKDLRGFFDRVAGRTAFWFAVIYVAVPVLSYSIGDLYMSTKEDWLTIVHPSLEVTKDAHWIVVGYRGDDLLVTLVRGKNLDGNFRYVTSTAGREEPIEMSRAHLGALTPRISTDRFEGR